MNFDSLTDLVYAVYEEIKDRNSVLSRDPVPISTQLYPYLVKKFNIIEEKIPLIIDILVQSKMIFSFPVAEVTTDGSKGTINGFILTKGDVIQKVRKRYEELLEKMYTNEFNKKIPAEKVIVDLSSKRKEFNNRPLGIVANITTMLGHYQGYLERNILNFSEKIQNNQLKIAIEKSGPVDSFLISKASGSDMTTKKMASTPGLAAEIKKRTVDAPNFDELRAYQTRNTIEKTIKMYGIEFYTRVCFRDYQFSLIQKLIEDGHISKANELKIVQRLLEKERTNSDKDMKLTEHANDINKLMKCINDTLKSTKS